MASIHELLYESKNFDSVNVAELLKKIIANLRSTYSTNDNHINIDVAAEDIFLEVQRAIPWGLIINELISNVFKHAFTGTSLHSNALRIILKRENNSLVFDIKDNGKGLPEGFDIRKSNTLGMELVSILSEQIQASVETIPEESGARFVSTIEL
jgi:two-component sensor histidine kinase